MRTPNESVSINIRAKARQRDLIDSEFMLEASCREAEEALLDQSFFTVDAHAFAKFHRLLDHPLPPTDSLRPLLKIRNALSEAKPPGPHAALYLPPT